MSIKNVEQLGTAIRSRRKYLKITQKELAMKIGQSDSIEEITPIHWQRMTQECSLGWPMLRERIAQLCHKTLARLSDTGVRGAANNDTTMARVAGIIEERASLLLRRLK